MSLDSIAPGKSVPEDVNVIIEIPANADPVKYEVDEDSGAMAVDRFMATAMHYPCNYGYIPQTLCEDGDPADVLAPAQDACTGFRYPKLTQSQLSETVGSRLWWFR